MCQDVRPFEKSEEVAQGHGADHVLRALPESIP
jgi:hypothetical protein